MKGDDRSGPPRIFSSKFSLPEKGDLFVVMNQPHLPKQYKTTKRGYFMNVKESSNPKPFMNVGESGNPQPGQIWAHRKKKTRYTVIDTILSEDSAYDWVRHILYRSEGGQMRSRRVSQFMDKFEYITGDSIE